MQQKKETIVKIFFIQKNMKGILNSYIKPNQ